MSETTLPRLLEDKEIGEFEVNIGGEEVGSVYTVRVALTVLITVIRLALPSPFPELRVKVVILGAEKSALDFGIVTLDRLRVRNMLPSLETDPVEAPGTPMKPGFSVKTVSPNKLAEEGALLELCKGAPNRIVARVASTDERKDIAALGSNVSLLSIDVPKSCSNGVPAAPVTAPAVGSDVLARIS
ncbi:hypothetical protein M501DRAFT_1016260 [Patellaria atrata CBS 101060]|uniref:Uncharacterized protein n=1 Tax=Patellaria atrata CBS 101060 TaxID=1346257 RepID=A0A9P4VPV1_9PEZI|nr:hypothetical protein M501DRAFT_1016260 [Patellaria atrata CBS 101060]